MGRGQRDERAHAAIAGAWQAPQVNTGDLRRALAGVATRYNANFDGTIPLRIDAAAKAQAPASPTAARLHFDGDGSLSVRLAGGDAGGRTPAAPDWTEGRGALVENLIDLVDAVVSLVPPDRLPMARVSDALSTLGEDS